MDVCLFCRGVASSEAESIRLLEGRPATSNEAESRGVIKGLGGEPSSEAEFAPRVRMGRTVYLGRGLGFFYSFPFLRIGGRL